MDQAGANSDSSVCVIDGTVTVIAASFLGALGAASSDNSHFETLDIIAPISGSAALQVSGANINSGDDTGVVKLSAANAYEGVITVTNADNNVVASAVHRILELNNLNALGNATLNLVATAVNPVSFSESVNSLCDGGTPQKDIIMKPQEALARIIEHREILHDEMLSLMRQIMRNLSA